MSGASVTLRLTLLSLSPADIAGGPHERRKRPEQTLVWLSYPFLTHEVSRGKMVRSVLSADRFLVQKRCGSLFKRRFGVIIQEFPRIFMAGAG
ncbi:hypothetical protein QBC34DRAFT_217648 [Podospora aff. communis PSN243]|uniref:Secreted protein n=1 Tax=Podospora aff. communis PSN243 TaxID=3040156 RepID=A0AAV9GZL8_9PEZI|nr:hypothetical protein QBC34DRAFT_217648 [Podospora aff. communis PSN243]